MTLDEKQAAILAAVWETRGALTTDPRERGRMPALIVLVGFDLWTNLRKRPEIDDPADPWSDRDNVLRVVDAEVHVAEPPLVADTESWHLVRDLGRAG